MASSNIMIIQGHPDATQPHLCHALAEAYAEAAIGAGHAVRRIAVSELEFPLLRSADEFIGELPPGLADSRDALQWADHLLIVYPLWLGAMPALLKAYLEQLFRPGIALDKNSDGWPKPLLRNKSGRIVVTMGMPAMAYRWFYRAHSLRSLERNILRFSGMKPVRDTVVGMVDNADERQRRKWFSTMRRLGAEAA